MSSLDPEVLTQEEAALWTEEQAVEARVELVRRRRLALAELSAHVEDRKMALRARLHKAGLRPDDLGLPDVEVRPSFGGDLLRADAEAEEILMARAALIERRRAVLQSRRSAAASALSEELAREELLVARDHALTEALRAMVLRSTPGGGAQASGRRARPRIEIKLAIEFGSDHVLMAESQNLSAGGLFVATRDVLALDRRVRAVVHLPQEGEVVAEGVVAWRRPEAGPEGPAGFGLRFVDLTEATQLCMRRFLQRHTASTE